MKKQPCSLRICVPEVRFADRTNNYMSQQTRSLRHEYELYVEREIEAYKESVPRSVLLGIGDEAVRSLASQDQLALTEMILWEEVDRIISKRIRLPSYSAWRRRRLRRLAAYRRPEHWGLTPDDPLMREVNAAADGHVLLSAPRTEGSALYFAAHGCSVIAVEAEEDAVERVVAAAEAVGLSSKVTPRVTYLDAFAPDEPLMAVVCSTAAFAHLTPEARARAIAVLQSATLDGGVHLVETLVAGDQVLTLEELEERYRGWRVSVQSDGSNGKTFVARKGAA